MSPITYTFSIDGQYISVNNGSNITLNTNFSDDTLNTLYNDANITIYYFDLYNIRIKNDTFEYKFENVQWDFTLKKTNSITGQIVIENSQFDYTVTISCPNVKFDNCTFTNANNTSLNLYNSSNIQLALDNCDFAYNYNNTPISGIGSHTLNINNSSIIISSIVSSINLNIIYNLLNTNLKFILDLSMINSTPIDFVFDNIIFNIPFKLNNNIRIKDTIFSRNCTFDLNGNDLTFEGCTFNNHVDDAFICTTYNNSSSSNLMFTKSIDNYNIINPRKSQLINNKLWNWNLDANADNSSLNITPSSTLNFIKLILDTPDMSNYLNTLYYFKSCFIELGITGNYDFGTSSESYGVELNLIISANTNTINGNNDIILTVYNDKSLNIINNNANVNIKMNSLTNIIASSGIECINIESTSTNKDINIAGTYTNNNSTFIDSNIIASIYGNVILNIETNYDMVNENNLIVGTANYTGGNLLTTNINGSDILLIITNTTTPQTGTNYNFFITGDSSLSTGSDISLASKFTIDNNFSLTGTLNGICTFISTSVTNLTFNTLTLNATPVFNLAGNLNIINSTFNNDLITVNAGDESTIAGTFTINDSTINGNATINVGGNINITSAELKLLNSIKSTSGDLHITGSTLTTDKNNSNITVLSGILSIENTSLNNTLSTTNEFKFYIGDNIAANIDNLTVGCGLNINSTGCDLSIRNSTMNGSTILDIGGTILINRSVLENLDYITIRSDLNITESILKYGNANSNITVTNGILNISESTLEPILSTNSFTFNITGANQDHLIDKSILNCNNTFNLYGGDLDITSSKILGNSYNLSGGNIQITNSLVDDSDAITYINILSTTTNSLALTNSVINIYDNKSLVSGASDDVDISGSTLNIKYTNPNFNTLFGDTGNKYDNNILNFDVDSTVTIYDYIENSNKKITSERNITITSASDIIKSTIYINGDKKAETARTDVVPTYGYASEITDTGSTANITFDNFTMHDINSGYYINYGTNSNSTMSIDISNITFVLKPDVYSIDFNIYNNLNTISGNKIMIGTDGDYLIGNDNLVKKGDTNQNIHIKNINLKNIQLFGTAIDVNFLYRLIINIEQLDNSFTALNLKVYSTGLNINDNRVGGGVYQPIVLTGSNINISGVSDDTINALNLNVNTSKSNITIDNSTFTTNNMLYPNNSFIHLVETTQSTSGDRIVNIGSNTWTGYCKYFIHNDDNTFLNVNHKPGSGITRNEIFWPKLVIMSSVSNPLSGTAVKFAESWDTSNFVSIINKMDVLVPGLYATWSNTDNKSLIFVQAYSILALGSTTSLTYTLTKNYTSSSTKHTGKFSDLNSLSGLSDVYNITDLASGIATLDIGFLTTRLVLMPKENNINIKITDSGNVDLFNKQIYQITNSDTIMNSSGESLTVEEYLQQNFKLIDTGGTETNANISMSDIVYLIKNGDSDAVNTISSKAILFKITPISGTYFNFLTTQTIEITVPNVYLKYTDSNEDDISILNNKCVIQYNGIDSEDNYSEQINIVLSKNPYEWDTLTITATILVDTNYYNDTNNYPAIDINIKNNLKDTQIYATKLGTNNGDGTFTYNINSTLDGNVPITTGLTLTNTTFTATNTQSIDNKYEFNDISLGLFIPSINSTDAILDDIVLSVENIKLGDDVIDNTNPDGHHVIIQLQKQVENPAGTWTAADNSNISSTETDSLIRYKCMIRVENVQDLYYNTNYAISFDIYNINYPTYTPQTIVINWFRLPVIVQITKEFPGDIIRNVPFDMRIKLSGKLNGTVNVSFTDNGSNILDVDNTPYNYDPIIQNSMKFNTDDALVLASTSVVINNNNGQLVTYKLEPPNQILGSFKMNCNITQITPNTIDGVNTDPYTITAFGINNLQYTEDMEHKITITMDKLLNTSGYETINDVYFGSNATNKLLVTDQAYTKYIVAEGFAIKSTTGDALDNGIASGNISPLNKFTRFYITIESTDISFNLLNAAKQSIVTTFIFKDEDGILVTDIEVVEISDTGTTSILNNGTSDCSITIDNLVSDNNYKNEDGKFNTTGNTVLLFRRNHTGEQNYSKLYVYFKFSNMTDTNYQNLNTEESLLGIIDYTNVGLISSTVSHLHIGNYKLVPTGDGKYLILTPSISTNIAIPNYIIPASNDLLDNLILN